ICRRLEKDRLLSAQYNLFRPKPAITDPPSKRQRVERVSSQPASVPAAITHTADDPDSAGSGSSNPAGSATPMAGSAASNPAGDAFGAPATDSTITTTTAMDSAGSCRKIGVSPFADSAADPLPFLSSIARGPSPSNVSTDHIPIAVLFESTSGGINEFFLESDEEEQIGMLRVVADPDSDDEVLAEIIFRGKSISGDGIMLVDKLPDDEIVDPRVKVETVSEFASSPPRSRCKHLGVRSDDFLWDKPVEDFFSSESESDDDIENYIPPLPYGEFQDWEIVSCPPGKFARKNYFLTEIFVFCDEVIDKGDCSNEVVHKRTEILNKIHQVNNIQASEIAQKAKIKWAIEGDENVKFDNHQSNQPVIDTPFPVSLSIDQKEDMERKISKEEVKMAVLDCGVDKSPGPDGNLNKDVSGVSSNADIDSSTSKGFTSRVLMFQITTEIAGMRKNRGSVDIVQILNASSFDNSFSKKARSGAFERCNLTPLAEFLDDFSLLAKICYIVTAVIDHDPFFRSNMDCAGRQGISGLLKCTSAIRQLAYGVHADFLDEYMQINDRTSRTALDHFCQAEWFGCPYAFKAHYVRRDHGPNPFILLEAVKSQDLWIWYAFFGVAGSNNDINVLYQSPLFNDLKTGRAPEIPFVDNDVTYRSGYHLVDGIYPELAPLVKRIPESADDDHKRILYK
ncbi:ALP1-like protein isoform X1, partial [Tanacetum coccineum]